MTFIFRNLTIAIFALTLCVSATFAQNRTKATDYKISGMTLTPFDEASGKFEEPLSESGGRSFFNDLSTSLFVSVNIAGQTGTFEPGRMVTVTVMEGKKLRMTRRVQVGLIGDGGFYHVPVFIYGSVCEKLTITARLSGQKTLSSSKRSVTFVCGE